MTKEWGVSRCSIRIGELPRIPEGARAMLDRYDEIWAGSDFIASALREATRKTVRLIPQPLNLSAASPQVRPRSDTLRIPDLLRLRFLHRAQEPAGSDSGIPGGISQAQGR